MIEKPGRALILISCACAIFWPGAFIFGRYLAVGRPGGGYRLRLRNPVCSHRTAGRRLLRHGPFRGHLRADFHRLRVLVRTAGSVAKRLYSGLHPRQLHTRLFLSGIYVPGFCRTHPIGSAQSQISVVKPKEMLALTMYSILLFYLILGWLPTGEKRLMERKTTEGNNN